MKKIFILISLIWWASAVQALECNNEDGSVALTKDMRPRGTGAVTLNFKGEETQVFFGLSKIDKSQAGCFIYSEVTSPLSTESGVFTGELVHVDSYGMNKTRCIGAGHSYSYVKLYKNKETVTLGCTNDVAILTPNEMCIPSFYKRNGEPVYPEGSSCSSKTYNEICIPSFYKRNGEPVYPEGSNCPSKTYIN